MASEELIEEVRKFPVLYDQSDEKYRHAEYKERVWKTIAETLQTPGGPEECRKRWASIRDQFRRTLQKRKTKSGQGAAKKQKYKYEEILEFLLPHIVERETLSNTPSTVGQKADSEFDLTEEEPGHDPECLLESQNEVLEYPGTSSCHTTAQPAYPAEYTRSIPDIKYHFPGPMNVKRRGSNNYDKFAQEPLSSQLIAFILAEKEAEKNKVSATDLQQHPVDIFLAGLAPTLKSLDPVLLNQAKSAIFATVQEFELKQLSKNERGQLSHSTSSHSSFPTESPL